MQFVVDIDLDSERTDRKSFDRRQDAENRFTVALLAFERDHPLRSKGRKLFVMGCRLYEAAAMNAREAHAMVEAGTATLLRSDENPYPDLAIDLDLDL